MIDIITCINNLSIKQLPFHVFGFLREELFDRHHRPPPELAVRRATMRLRRGTAAARGTQ